MELEEQVAALSARVEELEKQVTELVGTVTARTNDPLPPPAATQPPAAVSTPPPPPPTVVWPTPPASRPRPPWLTTETMLKWTGVLLVVLAAVFFVGTAIGRGWIGPELQLAGATAGGLALIAGGFHLIDRNRPWAAALATGGAAILAVCAAATNGGLDLIGEYPALALLAAVTVGLAVVSHRLSLESVATAAGLAAVVLPLWIVEDIDVPPAVLAGWMAVLIVAASGFGWFQGWALLRLATTVIAAFVLFVLLASESGELSTGQRYLAGITIAVVAAVAWAGPTGAGWLGRPAADGWRRGLDHRAVLSVPLWAWGSAAMAAELADRALALAGFGIAAAFTVLALAARSALPRTVFAAHLLGVGILVSISMAVLTDGPGLLVGLAAQAAATAVVGWYLGDRWLLALAGLLGVVAVGWAATSTIDGLLDQLPIGQLLANLFVVALLAGGALLHRRQRSRASRPTKEAETLGDQRKQPASFADEGGETQTRRSERVNLPDRAPSRDQLTVVVSVVAWIGLLGWIGSAFGHRAQGQVIVSLLWTLLAAAALVYGVRSDDHGARVVGVTTLGVVLVKLLTVDLAEVDTLWRVGLFLVVGTGLLRLGYVLPRLSRTGPGQPPH